MTKPARLPGLMIVIVCLLAAFAMTNSAWAVTPLVSAGGNQTLVLKADGTLWGFEIGRAHV